MSDNFKIPKFDDDAPLDTHYRMLLYALDLLKDTEDIDLGLQKAEASLAKQMPAFKLVRSDGATVETAVGAGKYKTAAFMFALWRERGSVSMVLTGHLLKMFKSYISSAVVADARTNPGKHATVDLFDTELPITLYINLAKTA